MNWHGWLALASMVTTAYLLGQASGYSQATKMVRKAFKQEGGER